MSTANLLSPRPAAPRRDPSPRLWTDAEFTRMMQLSLFPGRGNGTLPTPMPSELVVAAVGPGDDRVHEYGARPFYEG